MLCETPGKEPASDPRIARANPFPFSPATVSITATKQTQPTRVADCGGEPPAGNKVHRCEWDRMFNTEYLGQAVADGHLLVAPDIIKVQLSAVVGKARSRIPS